MATDPPGRLRADAQRNRDAILATALQTFETEGVFAPLDGIALRAGVGNATLYRNFPTREDLLAAVIRSSVDVALIEAQEMAASQPPRQALANWLVRLGWQLRIWHDLPYCVAAVSDDAQTALSTACGPLIEQTRQLLRRAQEAGEAVADLSAADVFELVTAVSWAVDRFGDTEAAASRRIGIATAGIFTRPS